MDHEIETENELAQDPPDEGTCPECGYPSYRGGLCAYCSDDEPDEPSLPIVQAENILGAWIVPPVCQGQIVEVAYASGCDGVYYRRIFDRSDRSTSYARANARDCGCEDECNCFDPVNSEPGDCFDWEPIRVIGDGQ